MTFAQLARTVLGDMEQSSMTKLREAYQAQPYVGAVTPECKVDTHSSVHDFPQELLIIKEYQLDTISGGLTTSPQVALALFRNRALFSLV